MHIRTILLVFCATIFAATAWAGYDMTGTWSSTSGSTIVIPDKPDEFILVVTHKDGEVFKLKAKWIKGLVGTQFTFTNEYGRQATVTIDSQNKDRARLTVEDRVYYWQRR